ncbi:MAG: hypothetical protein ACRDRC_01320 [Pseudonocardiaceae bacterium]
MLNLEARGEGTLLRADDGIVYYLIVGLSCRRLADTAGVASNNRVQVLDDLPALLHLACESRTPALEALDTSPSTSPVPTRILVLPDEPLRHHC